MNPLCMAHGGRSVFAGKEDFFVNLRIGKNVKY